MFQGCLCYQVFNINLLIIYAYVLYYCKKSLNNKNTGLNNLKDMLSYVQYHISYFIEIDKK